MPQVCKIKHLPTQSAFCERMSHSEELTFKRSAAVPLQQVSFHARYIQQSAVSGFIAKWKFHESQQ